MRHDGVLSSPMRSSFIPVLQHPIRHTATRVLQSRQLMREASRLLPGGRHTPQKSYGTLVSARIDCSDLLHGTKNPGDEESENGIVGHDEPVSRSTSTWRRRLQIPLLCYVRVMEPVSYYSIFPYIAQMTRHNGNLSDTDIGLYTGLFESLFSAVQALLLIFWGSMADRVGYKRMLICTLSGMTVTPVLFGLSTSLWQMGVFRGLNGAFAGSNIILRSMLTHHCTSETQVRAFSWYTFADNFALFIGPLMGGALADPVAQYPAIFKGIAVFERFPYLLPGIVGGAACASGVLVAMFFLDDTESAADTEEDPCEYGGLQTSGPSLNNLIKAPGISALLCMLMSVKFLVSSMTSASTTALDAPVSTGGMGYSSRQIALLIAAMGAAETVWLLLVFPLLHPRIGTKGILYCCTVMFVAVFASYISMSATLRFGEQPAIAWHWVACAGVVIFGSGVLMAGTSGQLALQNLAPDRRGLGTVNAVAETCTSIIKTVTPAASTAIFAIGASTQALHGYLIWVVLICISPILLVTAKQLPIFTDCPRK